ncbi:MAG: gamma-glutamylcyclotransferase family protein [Gammaproteobacteria bacterium]
MTVDYLFVYGTLRRTFDNVMAQWLSRHAGFFGTAFFRGALYEVDRYPAAVPCLDEYSRVFGDLYRFNDPEQVFAALDDYEECSDRFPKPHEYRRLKSEILLPDDGSIMAWIYLYNFPIERLERIRSGDYVSYLLEKTSA